MEHPSLYDKRVSSSGPSSSRERAYRETDDFEIWAFTDHRPALFVLSPRQAK